MLGQVVAFINLIIVFGITKNFIILYDVSFVHCHRQFVCITGITLCALTSANQCQITTKAVCIQFNPVPYCLHVNSWQHFLKPCTQMNVKMCDY